MRRTLWVVVAVLGCIGALASIPSISGRSAHAVDESKAGFIHAKGEPFFINRSNITYVRALKEGRGEPERNGKPPYIEVYLVGNEKPLLLHGPSAQAVLDALTRE